MRAHKDLMSPDMQQCFAADSAAPEGSAAPMAEDMQSLLQRPLPAHEYRSAQGHGAGAGVRIGVVAQAGEEGLWVQLSPEDAPLPAQALCPLCAEDAGRACAVLFVDGDPQRPLVVGCIVDGGEYAPEALLRHAPKTHVPDAPLLGDKHEVVVDGEVVRIEAQRELELRCGESVIVLQKDGRIEIRGNYVTSQATATQRLRGGSVHIN